MNISELALKSPMPSSRLEGPAYPARPLKLDEHLHSLWSKLKNQPEASYWSLRPWITLWVTRALIYHEQEWYSLPTDAADLSDWRMEMRTLSRALFSYRFPELGAWVERCFTNRYLSPVMWPTKDEVRAQALLFLDWRQALIKRRATNLDAVRAYQEMFGCPVQEAEDVPVMLKKKVHDMNRVSKEERHEDIVTQLEGSGGRVDATPAAQIAATRALASTEGIGKSEGLSLEKMIQAAMSKKPEEKLDEQLLEE